MKQAQVLAGDNLSNFFGIGDLGDTQFFSDHQSLKYPKSGFIGKNPTGFPYDDAFDHATSFSECTLHEVCLKYEYAQERIVQKSEDLFSAGGLFHQVVYEEFFAAALAVG